MDGTLANTLYSIVSFSNEALRRCGYGAVPEEDYRKIIGDGADMQVRRMLGIVRGEGAFTEQEAARVREAYGDLYGSDPLHLLENYPGMQETIAALRKAGIRTAVLSNKPDAWTQAIVASLFPSGSFDLCIGQRPGLPRKPSPEGALHIAREFGLFPSSILYIGDTDTDMKTGQNAGMDTAGALWGFRTRRELEENHATYIVETPEELLPLVIRRAR